MFTSTLQAQPQCLVLLNQGRGEGGEEGATSWHAVLSTSVYVIILGAGFSGTAQRSGRWF